MPGPMSLLRLVVAWLLMAALPLQGMAAASMLFCGAPAAARVAQTASHQGHHASMGMSAHDHSAHGHEGMHASHGQQAAGAEVDQMASHAPEVGGDAAQSHSCPVCAACSQAQAVGGSESLPLAAPAPSAEPSQPPVRVSSRSLTLPDKPPRG
jgi:hypothetical protein